MKKSELNQNIYIQEGNSVLVDDDSYGFLIFSLPVRETCPYATDMCKKICYGRNAQELFKHVYACRKKNFNESVKDTFVKDMIDVIDFNLGRKKYKNKTIIFRIHETGDFYTEDYLNKWVNISNNFKRENRIIFQAYTKSLEFVRKIDLNNVNIKLMFSIMPDTKSEDIELAKEIGLNTFSAISCEYFEKINEQQQCKGNCAECKSCYPENKNMYVEFHGNRVPRKRGRIAYDKQLYWSWKHEN